MDNIKLPMALFKKTTTKTVDIYNDMNLFYTTNQILTISTLVLSGTMPSPAITLIFA